MTTEHLTPEVTAKMDDLRIRLAEAEATLRAIRNGELDAVVVGGERGERLVYTLSGANRIYRQLVETMSEGAATLSDDRVILYCNALLAQMLGLPLDHVLGTYLRDYLPPADQAALDDVLAKAHTAPIRREISLKARNGGLVPVYLSASRLPTNEAKLVFCLVLTDLTEQKSQQRILASELRYRRLFESAKDGILILDAETGMVVDVNPFLIELLGFSRDDILDKKVWELGLFADIAANEEKFAELRAKNYVRYADLPLKTADGRAVAVEFVSNVYLVNAQKVIQCNIRDITASKQAEVYREMNREVTELLNTPGNLQSAIQSAIATVKKGAGCDAVGLRLQAGEDFPYYAQQGFSEEFLLTENTLLERDTGGAVCRDGDGNVSLECTCGLVISGKTIADNPLFTKGGSFWTNDSSPLLELRPEEDPRHHPRNQCIHQGYASVALVPIRSRGRIIGLIHLNDRRKGRFSIETIQILEGIAEHIGEALMRKRSEETLRKSESAQRKLSESLARAQTVGRVGSWETDIATLETQWSEQTHRIFETTPDTFNPTHAGFLEFVHPADRDAVNTALMESTISSAQRSIEHRIVMRDGRIKHVEERWQLFDNVENHPTLAIGTCQDITERKQAEEALRASEHEFRSLAESMPQIVWITRPDGWNIYFNQQWVDYTGLTLLQSYGHGWNTPFHPDDKQRAWDAWQRATAQNGTYSIEARLRRADGTYHWWLIRGAPLLDAGGAILKWFGTCTDIEDIKQAEDERRASEQLFRYVLETAKEAIWSTNTAGQYESMSPIMAQIYGRPLSELLSDPTFWMEAVHPEDQAMVRSSNDELRRNSRTAVEYRIILPDGTIRWLSDRKAILRDQHGEKFRMAGIVSDITERKQAEENLRRSHDELEQRISDRTHDLKAAKQAAERANMAKSDFLANMSHELRTPLNAVIGFSQMLGDQYFGPLNSKQSEYVQDIQSSGKHLLDLINDILDLAKVEAGKTVLELTEFPLRDLVENSLLMLRERAAERGLTLEARIEPELMDLRLTGDLRRLKQVMFNLLSNAVKFTQEGGRIDVSANLANAEVAAGMSKEEHCSPPAVFRAGPEQRQGVPGSALVISISDTGTGIAPEEQTKIFEEFYQVANHAAGKATGTGLGLGLSRRFVALHGGSLWVESAGLGHGSTFSFSVPTQGFAGGRVTEDKS